MQELSHAEWMSLFVLASNAATEANLQGLTEPTRHYLVVAAKCSSNADSSAATERERDAKLVSDAADYRAYREATSLSKLKLGAFTKDELAQKCECGHNRSSHEADRGECLHTRPLPGCPCKSFRNSAEFVGENFTAALARRRAENPDLDLDEHGFDRSESGYDPDEDRTP